MPCRQILLLLALGACSPVTEPEPEGEPPAAPPQGAEGSVDRPDVNPPLDSDEPHSDDDVEPTPGPPPELDAVVFGAEVGNVLAGCAPSAFDLGEISALPVLVADLDGDGTTEILLANQTCPNAAGEPVVSPIVRYVSATGRLVVGESFHSHLSGGSIVRPLNSAAFLDLDLDGDADLVGGILLPDRSPAMVWWNDGTGTFSPAPIRFQVEGWSYAEGANVGITDVEGDGRAELVLPILRAGSSRVEAGLLRTADPEDLWVEQGRLAWLPGLGSWTFLPLSLRPTEQPWSHLFAVANLTNTEEDYIWNIPDGSFVPTDFVGPTRDPISGLVVDGALLLQPICATESPVCFTPMGGSTIRFPFRGPAGLTHRDCAAISTGDVPLPVSVLCPRPSLDGFEESGVLSRALRGPVLPSGDSRLAWLVSATWDLNADGWMDVLLTNGRDIGRFPKMPSYAYLQTPECYAETCERFVRFDLPVPPGHHHGAVWLPVQRANGAWRMLGLLGSDADIDVMDADVGAFTWDAVGDARWIALQIGALHDLPAAGAVVRSRFTDPSGRRLGATEEVLVSVASTWGMPVANSPIVIGVPRGATLARIEVDFPGCQPTVVEEGSVFNRPWQVDVPACP